MKPGFSEFSYGYALTEELVHSQGSRFRAVPVFPSLYDEGRPGGGWDMMLRRPTVPLFVQFKLGHCLIQRNAREVRDGLLNVPYYRMHLMRADLSDQHRMLLDLENAGNDVRYAAPMFHQLSELNDAYVHRQVRQRSLWLKPSFIGPINDNIEHYVAYQQGTAPIYRSEPRKITGKVDYDSFGSALEKKLTQSSARSSRRVFEEILASLVQIAERRKKYFVMLKDLEPARLEGRHPLELVAIHSQLLLDSHLFLVQWKRGRRA